MTDDQATTTRLPRPEPVGDVLVRTRQRDTGDIALWEPRGNGVWWDRRGRWSATWTELDDEKYGPVELLVPVAYRTPMPGDPGHALAQQVAEQVLEPIAAMMQQLAAAAGAGITATVAEAYRRGMADAHTVERNDPSRLHTGVNLHIQPAPERIIVPVPVHDPRTGGMRA